MSGLMRLVRWVAVVVALAGGMTLASSRALAEGEIPGDVEPLPAIVYVVDCPYEGADLSECATVEGVPIDVTADGVPVEGSGAVSAQITEGFSGITVRLPAIGASVTASAPGASVTVATPDLVYGGCENGVTCAFIRLVRIVDEPSSASTFVNVVVANCPYAEADVSDLCTRVEGATVHVAVDGVEVEDSPRVTMLGPVGVQTRGFAVPVGATLTLWNEPLGGGFVPADGYDPLTISPDAFYLGGCGGESRCSYVFLINVPADDGAGEPVTEPADEPTPDVDEAPGEGTGEASGSVDGEVVTRLPDTGIGPVDRSGAVGLPAQAGMIAWTLLAAAAVIAAGSLRRRPTR